MPKKSAKPQYVPAEAATELEAAAADEHGQERLEDLALAAKHWTDAGDHTRALDLLAEPAAALREYPELNWLLPLYAYNLFAVGRTEQAWAVVDAAEQHARTTHSSYDYEQLAGYLLSAGHPDRALVGYTAALELLLSEDDRNPALPLLPRETSAVPRVRAARRELRASLGLPPDAHDLTTDQPVLRAALRERLRRRRDTA
ncbi:hypothetical protein [Kitasatospora kifunensis]|uniref:Tetratricopeptide (TPR) repeat protein n=1 Tax=Kitasatospora kifunensis TaxID=58351 RepID=A0A7W7VYY0_KITKI|nr:hypothetical protein [Kitasatospora kifunensis]MBB4927508.1 tetratricopeptide (TPR) repeat protein [Kitasatospora kifunensis]